jgi:hypothetical protein
MAGQCKHRNREVIASGKVGFIPPRLPAYRHGSWQDRTVRCLDCGDVFEERREYFG